MHRRQLILSGLAATAGASGLSACATAPAADPNYPIRSDQEAPAYTADELIAAGSGELGTAAEAIGAAIERIFADQGDRPTAYIAGEEGAGAAGADQWQVLVFEVEAPGEGELRLVLGRPWIEGDRMQDYRLTVRATARPER